MQFEELEVGGRLALGPNIWLTVLEILGGSVRLQIDAPPHVLITVTESVETPVQN
jgi:sRNA-binding carbon storage regulator CsrA